MLDPEKLTRCIEGAGGDITTAAQLSRIAKAIDGMNDNRRRIYDAYAKEDLSAAEYIEASRAIDEDIVKLRRKKEAVQAASRQAGQANSITASIRHYCATARARFEACADLDDKRAFLHDYVERITFDHGKITVLGSLPLEERRTVRAPIAARVLQIKIHPGEFAQSGVLVTPLMLLGDDMRLNVRVDIDENDAWRVLPDAAALAYVRSNPELKTALKFERIERYVVPKVSLTGDSTERTDMRVLQVLYSFDPTALPVYVGQQMEVYIEAPPAGAARPERTLGTKP
jgi:HlyD family secretion protein